MTVAENAPTEQHTITALVQNEAGTINRLVSLFRRRGFSIACFNAGDCEQPEFSRLTLVVNGSRDDVKQCVRQLEKLIDVVEAQELAPAQSISKELALIKVEKKDGLEALLDPFGATVAEHLESGAVVQAALEPAQIEALIEALQPFQVIEIVRTGAVAMRTSKTK